MNMLSMPLSLRHGAFAVALLATGAASGAAQDLPAASDVLARYQQAVGGREALAAHQSIHSVGELSMPAQGLSAEFESYSARPNRSATRVSIAGFGEIRSGFTGEVAWSLNPMEGPRVMSGKELAQAAEESTFESSLRLAEVIESAETVERTKIGGRDCLKVRLTWKSGRQTHDCYSEETGLLVGSIATQETNMGALESVTLFDEYREFGGLRMPTRVTIQVMGMEQIINIRDIHFDVADAGVFTPPAEIQALIGS
jgi:hypothetical protein